MKFLEFVGTKLMGPPVCRRDAQRLPYWYCPRCEKLKFHVMPDKPGTKPRYRCWVCMWDGKPCDEYDLLWHFRPERDYGWRLQVIDGWRQEWAAAFPPGNPPTREQLVAWIVEKVQHALAGRDPACKCVWSRDWLREKLAEAQRHPESVKECWSRMMEGRNGHPKENE
jgi:hypothetical protein